MPFFFPPLSKPLVEDLEDLEGAVDVDVDVDETVERDDVDGAREGAEVAEAEDAEVDDMAEAEEREPNPLETLDTAVEGGKQTPLLSAPPPTLLRPTPPTPPSTIPLPPPTLFPGLWLKAV